MSGGGRVRAFGAVIAAGFALLAVGLSSAGAAETPTPVVRDYASYPLAVVPESCRSTPVAQVLVGVRFSSGGVEAASLRALPLTLGSVVTMRWDSFAAGCEGIGVGISDKVNNAVVFDHLANQFGSDGAYCGSGGDPCTAPYELTLTIGARGGFTCFQVDAHVGPQLAVIGPAGGYYELNNAIYPTLISAFNGGGEPCRFTPCEHHPELPAASIECRIANGEPSTTSTQPPPPEPVDTTAPPATAAVASSAPTSTVVTATSAPSVSPASTATTSGNGAATVLAARAANPPQALPATGPTGARVSLSVASLLVSSGLILARATRRSKGAPEPLDLP